MNEEIENYIETDREISNKKAVFLIILVLIGLLTAYYFYKFDKISPKLNETESICIAKQSIVYTQPGCSSCGMQEHIFGDNYKYINSINCMENLDFCIQEEITTTPTWIINNKTYKGFQSSSKLKELTGC
jgi:hypothetical protein